MYSILWRIHHLYRKIFFKIYLHNWILRMHYWKMLSVKATALILAKVKYTIQDARLKLVESLFNVISYRPSGCDGYLIVLFPPGTFISHVRCVTYVVHGACNLCVPYFGRGFVS